MTCQRRDIITDFLPLISLSLFDGGKRTSVVRRVPSSFLGRNSICQGGEGREGTRDREPAGRTERCRRRQHFFRFKTFLLTSHLEEEEIKHKTYSKEHCYDGARWAIPCHVMPLCPCRIPALITHTNSFGINFVRATQNILTYLGVTSDLKPLKPFRFGPLPPSSLN